MPLFEPRIVAFCCDHSGYAAADMAGRLRLTWPMNVTVIRVPCAGRIETLHLLKALEGGADGVLVFACHEENCQSLRGNFRAKRRLAYAQELLEAMGIEKNRLEICHLATNNGVRFVEVLRQKSEELKKLGPAPGRK